MKRTRRNRSPQERKIRDYMHRRSSAYGANHKNGRRAVRKRKNWVNRSYRRSVSNLLVKVTQADDLALSVETVERHGWKKVSDQLSFIARAKALAVSGREKAKPNTGKLKKAATQRLHKGSRDIS